MRFDKKFYLDLKKKHIKQFYKEDFSGSYEYYLDLMREYLDSIGYLMPKPIYEYNPRDKRTWKYLDNNKMDKSMAIFRGKREIVETLNPNFIY